MASDWPFPRPHWCMLPRRCFSAPPAWQLPARTPVRPEPSDPARDSFPDQPNLGHLTTPAAATSAGFLIPRERQLAVCSGGLRDIELDWSNRRGLRLQRVNLHGIVGQEPNAGAEVVAGVNHTELIFRSGVQTFIAHLQRGIEKRFGMRAPGKPPIRNIVESNLR